MVFPVTEEELDRLFHMVKGHGASRQDSLFFTDGGVMVDIRLVAGVSIVDEIDADEDDDGGGEDLDPPTITLPQDIDEQLRTWESDDAPN